MQAAATVEELMFLEDRPSARIACPAGLVPLAGQYVLAHEENADDSLASVLVAAVIQEAGFVCAPPIHPQWRPGVRLRMRGPLGKPFSMPALARRVALVAMGQGLAVLLPLLTDAVSREAAVVVVSDSVLIELPLQVEVQPMSAAPDVLKWSDYAAFDVPGNDGLGRLRAWREEAFATTAQALVRISMPCGGIADCGVCTIRTAAGPKLACKDGPVFELKSLCVEG